MNNEIWKQVKDFRGYYEISNYGQVKSMSRLVKGKHGIRTMPHKEKILKPRIGKYGYAYVIFSVDGFRKTQKVHRLVADAFLEKPEGFNVVNHLDGNKANNHVSNLEWTNNEGNMKHAVEKGLILKGSMAPGAILNEMMVYEMRKLFNEGVSQKAIGKLYSLNRHRVFDIVRNRIWKHVKL